MQFDFTKLNRGDLIFTSSKSILGDVIRFFTWGKKETFDTNFPNHVGIIVEWMDYKFIAEMLSDGLRFNSLYSYDGTRGDKICKIYRLTNVFPDSAVNMTYIDTVTQNAQKQIAQFLNKQLRYDFKGLLEFIGLAKNSDSRMYCSELAARLYSQELPGKARWSPKDLLVHVAVSPAWKEVIEYTCQEK